jgi:hypothetical protein
MYVARQRRRLLQRREVAADQYFGPSGADWDHEWVTLTEWPLDA